MFPCAVDPQTSLGHGTGQKTDSRRMIPQCLGDHTRLVVGFKCVEGRPPMNFGTFRA